MTMKDVQIDAEIAMLYILRFNKMVSRTWLMSRWNTLRFLVLVAELGPLGLTSAGVELVVLFGAGIAALGGSVVAGLSPFDVACGRWKREIQDSCRYES